jgi:hypothetical protein
MESKTSSGTDTSLFIELNPDLTATILSIHTNCQSHKPVVGHGDEKIVASLSAARIYPEQFTSYRAIDNRK